MGGWGYMGRYYGHISMGISPFEQSAFRGYIYPVCYNVFMRYVVDHWKPWLIPVAAWFYLDYLDAKYLKSLKKDPKQFENDV